MPGLRLKMKFGSNGAAAASLLLACIVNGVRQQLMINHTHEKIFMHESFSVVIVVVTGDMSLVACGSGC